LWFTELDAGAAEAGAIVAQVDEPTSRALKLEALDVERAPRDSKANPSTYHPPPAPEKRHNPKVGAGMKSFQPQPRPLQ